jgi:hypothetical protein
LVLEREVRDGSISSHCGKLLDFRPDYRATAWAVIRLGSSYGDHRLSTCEAMAEWFELSGYAGPAKYE